MRILYSLLFSLLSTICFSQSAGTTKRAGTQTSEGSQPTSLSPASREQQQKIPRQSRKKQKSNGPTFNSEKEFAERIESTAKASRKKEKMLLSPQYSNPMYFGHKRPPKKHPPNKMKYCKECGLRH